MFWYLYNANTRGWRLYIKAGGNVGIGTTSPAAPLHVKGEAIVGMNALGCSSTTSGAIRYNSSVPEMEWCNGSAWSPFSYCKLMPPYTASLAAGYIQPVEGMWGDGTYLYVSTADCCASPDLEAFTFNNATHTWTPVAHTTAASATVSTYGNIWGAGTYIYLPQDTTGIQAYSFNGTTFTPAGLYSTSMDAKWVWGDGTYIYVADGTNGLKAFTFNGTTFTLKGSITVAGINDWFVWGDGTYIYVGDIGHIKIWAYTFNGTTFTLKGSKTLGNLAGVWGDGTYIYIAEYGALVAYSFNGTTFTLRGTYISIGNVGGQMIGKNGNIYMDANGYIEVVSFNGSSFTFKGVLPTASAPTGISADNNNVYDADSYNSNIDAHPLCH